uniref:Integrase zinc-binding domain-containing protein n=1 Tax=Nicotiana tabacum TaxID=4097 RepID=A0A1S4D0S6_TOBAC|nr:PREDICTED: uncharacterized protein LOC107824727 [Nicotiana tabacum]
MGLEKQIYCLSERREVTRRSKVIKGPADQSSSVFTRQKWGSVQKSFRRPPAVCLGPAVTDYVLQKIHEGICGNHSGADSLVRKVIRVGYYWESMEKDTREFVRKCDKCQRFAPMIHQLGEQLNFVLSPWPFMK